MRTIKEPQDIICPLCGIKVARWDGRATTNIEVNCEKCNRRVVFYPETMETKTKKKPQRNCASGMTF